MRRRSESCAARSGEGLGVKWSGHCLSASAARRGLVWESVRKSAVPASMLYGIAWVLGTVLPSAVAFSTLRRPYRRSLPRVAIFHRYLSRTTLSLSH